MTSERDLAVSTRPEMWSNVSKSHHHVLASFFLSSFLRSNYWLLCLTILLKSCNPRTKPLSLIFRDDFAGADLIGLLLWNWNSSFLPLSFPKLIKPTERGRKERKKNSRGRSRNRNREVGQSIFTVSSSGLCEEEEEEEDGLWSW